MTEERLIARMKKRDVRALERLIDLYNGYVASIVSAVLGSQRRPEDVEELVSDVFLSVWNHAEALKPGKLRAYLGAAARNRAKSFLRKIREIPMDLDEIPALTEGNTPENRLLRREQSNLVREAVLQMPQPDREIFLRYYYYLQTSTQIAGAMGLTNSNVRVRLMRGRNTLKQTLCKEGVQVYADYGFDG